MNKIGFLFFLIITHVCFSQETDSVTKIVDTLSSTIDSVTLESYDPKIINEKAIKKSFEKLNAIEFKQYRKLRIVHLGDSHIQADIQTNYLREHFQNKFGNAGLGFAFPYKMAKTNGSQLSKMTSDISFENYRNIKPLDTIPVGLSGIALYTQKKDFSIELKVKEEYKFNSIRIITPKNVNSFLVANTYEDANVLVQTDIQKNIPTKTIGYTTKKIHKTINHKIKKGDVLSKIADKYKVSVAQIKKVNGLKSDRINSGKTLKIPTTVVEKTAIEEAESKDVASIEAQIINKEVTRKQFSILEQIEYPFSYDYYNSNPMDHIFLLPNTNFSNFTLNGVILEKDTPGVVYSAIGVNGAKCSDFNKYSLFFEQLPALEPDLFIISFGTNESFDKLESMEFIESLNELIDNIRLFNENVEILVTTPQPSQFGRKYKNHLIEAYTKSIIEQAEIKNYAVWDMYHDLGGAKKVNENYKTGLITSDKIHYTFKGYKKQADDFFQAFMLSYEFNKYEK